MEMPCSRDLISGLPDEILGKILSLLPTKVAASTSILSKRWRRNLLVYIDELCFDESMVVYSNEEEAKNGSIRFCDFVDKTIALFSNLPIKKFSLCRVYRFKGQDEDKRVTRCVNRWICTAMEHPLLELYLYAPTPLSCVSLGTKMFTSNTLVKLTLSGEYELQTERFYLPALKSLSLLSIYKDYDTYTRLIEGCPVLEELYIRDGDNLYYPGCGTDIESESLKRLVVFTDLYKDQDLHQLVYFDAPSLVYLDYTSYVFREYEVFDLDMLVEARLNIRLWPETKVFEPIFGDVTDLLEGIRNITSLHLSPDSLETLHFCCDSMPVFNNLLNLSIESDKKKGWQVMPLMIKSCPNLQTLVIKGLVHKVTNECGDACACILKSLKWTIVKKNKEVGCLRTCPVKELEVLEYEGSLQELNQMRHLLNNLECLETVKVGIHADKNINCMLVRADVMALPRLSSHCNIQFI